MLSPVLKIFFKKSRFQRKWVLVRFLFFYNHLLGKKQEEYFILHNISQIRNTKNCMMLSIVPITYKGSCCLVKPLCHLSESQSYSGIQDQEMSSKGAESVTSWDSRETGLPWIRLLRVQTHTCPCALGHPRFTHYAHA